MYIKNTMQLRQALRTGCGAYRDFYVMDDGSCLCRPCVNENYRAISAALRHDYLDGWRVVGLGHTGDCEDILTCDHCGNVIYDPED